MKLWNLFVGVLVCAVAVSFGSSNVSAQEEKVSAQEEKVDYSKVVGTWEMESEGRGGETRTYNWVFSMKDKSLVATIPARRRRGGGAEAAAGAAATREIEGVKLEGDKLSFSYEREGQNGTMTIAYTATIKDRKMTGTSAFGDRFSRDFTGEKASLAKLLVGTWEMESEGRGGETRKYNWVFSMKDKSLVATIPVGRSGDETIDVDDIKIDGAKLSFAVEREFGDNPITLEYSATLKDGKLAGTYGIPDRFSRDFTGAKAAAKSD